MVAMAQGVLHCFDRIRLHTKIFAEGIRHKIFDTAIVPAIGRELDINVRHSVLEIFIATVAQGAIHGFMAYSC
jgi:hypothetical protein